MRRWLCILLCLVVLGAASFAALADDMGLTSADVDAPVGLADDFGDTGLTLDDGSEEETVPEETEPEEGKPEAAPAQPDRNR